MFRRTYRGALILSIATMLAGCGGSQSPTGAPGAMPQTSAAVTHTERDGSWMLPEAKGSSLLYSSNYASRDVDIRTFPLGKTVGQLTGFQNPVGLCSDSAGNVFVTDSSASIIYEYAHGDTAPSAALSDSGYSPFDCSVSPHNDLAIANFGTTSQYGNVAVYANESGAPAFYSDPEIREFEFCSYDTAGNLFVSGIGNGTALAVAKLPSGGEGFRNLPTSLNNIHGIHWDGKNVAVGVDQARSATVYQVTAKNGGIKVKGTTPLSWSSHHVDLFDFWIVSNTLVGATKNGIGLWSYPGGGQLTHHISAPADSITVSLAPSR